MHNAEAAFCEAQSNVAHFFVTIVNELEESMMIILLLRVYSWPEARCTTVSVTSSQLGSMMM
jgi:hypothetical protein